MLVAVVLSIQAVAGPPAPREFRPPRIATPCPPPADRDDIVVCGMRNSQQRLEKLPDRHDPAPGDPLSFRLPGGGKGNVHAFQNDLPGATSQGLAVSIKLPFGRHAKPRD